MGKSQATSRRSAERIFSLLMIPKPAGSWFKRLKATSGTHRFPGQHAFESDPLLKIDEGRPNIVDGIKVFDYFCAGSGRGPADEDEKRTALPGVTGDLPGGNMRGDRPEDTVINADNTDDTWLEVLFLRQ